MEALGNGAWEVVGLIDPDGYRLDFESPTDVAEDTQYKEAVHCAARLGG
jgi:lactoylglutathione lyase